MTYSYYSRGKIEDLQTAGKSDFYTELLLRKRKKGEKMLDLSSTYFQVIQWMQNPSDSNSLRDFAEWKEKCDIKGQAYCSLPNACPLTTRELPGKIVLS